VRGGGGEGSGRMTSPPNRGVLLCWDQHCTVGDDRGEMRVLSIRGALKRE